MSFWIMHILINDQNSQLCPDSSWKHSMEISKDYSVITYTLWGPNLGLRGIHQLGMTTSHFYFYSHNSVRNIFLPKSSLLNHCHLTFSYSRMEGLPCRLSMEFKRTLFFSKILLRSQKYKW